MSEVRHGTDERGNSRTRPGCPDDDGDMAADTYCDDEQAMWEADPEGCEARIKAIRAEFQSLVPVTGGR